MSYFDSALYERYEELCKTRLSKNFILRDFMFSVDAAVAGHSNFPSDNVDQVIESGKQLCSRVLEPILAQFGRFALTFGYQCRETMELDPDHAKNPKSSSPHHWDRGGRFGNDIYARVDIWPYCVEDGEVSKQDFAKWIMMNLDIDLCMGWARSNVFCITISPKPRRVWLEWVKQGKGDGGSNKIEHMGRDFWENQFPKLSAEQRPRYHPSATNGRMWW
jgi:hypothetical protein